MPLPFSYHNSPWCFLTASPETYDRVSHEHISDFVDIPVFHSRLQANGLRQLKPFVYLFDQFALLLEQKFYRQKVRCPLESKLFLSQMSTKHLRINMRKLMN